MVFGVPIAVSLGLGAIGAIIVFDKYSALAIVHKMIGSIDFLFCWQFLFSFSPGN
jgi:hypothetical protein